MQGCRCQRSARVCWLHSTVNPVFLGYREDGDTKILRIVALYTNLRGVLSQMLILNALLLLFEPWHPGQEGRCRPLSFLIVLIIHTWKIHCRSLSCEPKIHVGYSGSSLLMFLFRVVLSVLKIGWREETACTGHHGYERRVEVL